MNKYRVLYMPTVTIEAEDLDAAMDAAKQIVVTGTWAIYGKYSDLDPDPKKRGRIKQAPIFYDVAQVAEMTEDSDKYINARTGEELEYEQPAEDSGSAKSSDGTEH